MSDKALSDALSDNALTHIVPPNGPDPSVLVLGPLALRDAKGSVRAVSGQQADVLSLLASAAPAPVRVEALVEAVWGSDFPKTSSTGLRVVITRLRDKLPPGCAVVAEGGHYRLDVDERAIDHRLFSAGLAAARDLTQTNQMHEVVETLERVLGLWRGAPFQPADQNDAVWPHAARLTAERAEAEELLAEALLALGRVDESVVLASRLVAEDELRDRRWHLLILGLYRAGRQAEALRTYQRVVKVYRDSFGLEPGPDLRSLEQSILQQDPSLQLETFVRQPTPARTDVLDLVTALTAEATAAPASAQPIIGRDAELEALDEVVRLHRLVTVTGPPGVGKTRLAASFARGFVDGPTLWLDLAIHEPDDAIIELATQLHVRAEPASIVGAVAGALRHTRALLVLDNCEQAAERVAPLVETMMATCPDLRILLTSRQILGSPSETSFELGPLAPHDARRLLLDRAFSRNERPTFDETDIERLVERLDRLPLAIELAAGLLRNSAPAEIMSDLESSASGLARARPTSDRHRSLTAALTWSTELLDVDEERAFRQLGTIRGTFHAADIARMLNLDESATNRLLGILADHSLISSRRDRPAGEYRVLETVRSHARQLLIGRSGLQAAHRAHADAYVSLLGWASPRWRGSNEEDAVRRVGAASGQIRAAFDWAIEEGETDHALAIATSVWDHALFRMNHEQQGWPLVVLDRLEAGNHHSYHELLGTAAMSCWSSGRFDEGLAFANRAVDAADHLGVPVPGSVSRARMNIAGARSDVAAGEAAATALLEHSRVHHDAWEHSAVLCTIAMAWTYVGDRSMSSAAASKSLELAQSTENASAIAWAVFGRGFTLLDQDPGEALRMFGESLRISRTVSNRWVQGMATAGAVTAHRRLGETQRAAAMLVDLIPHWQRSGMSSLLGSACREAALVLADLGHGDRARSALDAAAATGQPQPLLPRDEEALTRLHPQQSIELAEEDIVGDTKNNDPVADVTRLLQEAVLGS